MGVYLYQAEQKTKYVPQMTANTQDGYTATSSTQIWGDTEAWYAFFVSTQGGTNYPFHSPSIGAGNWAWSEIQLPEGIVVNNIEIGARKNESTGNLRPIAAFSLKGSNDGNTWTELKAVSGLGNSWSIGSVQNWDIEGQTTAYTYLKLEVQAKNSYVAFDYWNINGVLKDRELKNAYIGEVIECDFTKSDCGFVFYGRTATNITYGRDSNGLYCTRPTQLGACAWKIPSSIYSRGTIKKIEIELYSSSTQNGGGISYGVDTMFTRRWSNAIDSNWGSSNATVVGDSPAGGYIFTIDLENKIISSSDTLTTQTLTDANVSTIRNYRSGGNLNIVSMVVPANTYSYIKKATFYF